jgi:DNA-binding NarL/FixJ family response regulator
MSTDAGDEPLPIIPPFVSLLRLLVVDSAPVLLEGLTSLLRGEREFEVTAAADARNLRPLAFSAPIEVALVDIGNQSHHGWTDVRRVQEALPAARIVVMDEIVRDHQLRQAMRQHLAGLIVKHDPIKNIAEALLRTRESDFVVSASVIKSGYSPGRGRGLGPATPAGLHLLTARELDILRLIGDGLSPRRIAERLEISEHTIDNHKTRILRKLGMHRIVDLVRYAIGMGLSTVDPTTCFPPDEESESA